MSSRSVPSSRNLRAAVVAAGRGLAEGQHRLVVLAALLDVDGAWAFDGARTCAHWLARALDVEVSTAREWLRVGHALTTLDEIEHRFGNGTLSYSKVRVLTRVANPENQHELCELAQHVPAGALSVALARWLTARETPEQTERRQRNGQGLSWWVDHEGMIAGKFRLAPLRGATLTTAVDAQVVANTQRGQHASADAPAPLAVTSWPSIAQQRADALIDLIAGGGARINTEIVLHVRGDGCTLDDGTPIAGTVVERLAPESFLRALIHDADSRPINASGRQRHPTTRQKRVVKERDRVCRDCGATQLLHYDHEPDYDTSHRTVVDELELRCWNCHHERHRDGPGSPGGVNNR